jgi:hypothetical protein
MMETEMAVLPSAIHDAQQTDNGGGCWRIEFHAKTPRLALCAYNVWRCQLRYIYANRVPDIVQGLHLHAAAEMSDTYHINLVGVPIGSALYRHLMLYVWKRQALTSIGS